MAQCVELRLIYGVESARLWVRQADIDDGPTAITNSDGAAGNRHSEHESRELKLASKILRERGVLSGRSSSASNGFGQPRQPQQGRFRWGAEV